MTTIESFFMLAALVVFVGFLVWRRDVRSGRIPPPKRRGPSMSLRERLGDTGFRKQASVAASLSAGARVVNSTTGAPKAAGGSARDGGESGGS